MLLNIVPSWADSFHGRIIFTVTGSLLELLDPAQTTSEIPGLSIGDSFTGLYRYDSPTIDGVFDWANGLTGGVDLPGVFSAPFFTSTAPWFFPFAPARNAVLGIAGGQVQFFSFSAQGGAFGFRLDQNTFRMGCGAGGLCGFDPESGYAVANMIATGSVYVETPQVPEPASLWTIGFGLAALVAMTRRKYQFDSV